MTHRMVCNSFEEYREMEGLNWSTIKWASKCIQSMRAVQKQDTKPSPDMVFGQDVHAAVLEPNDFQTRVSPGPTGVRRNSKAWKDAEAQAQVSGRRIVKPDEYIQIMDIISSVSSNKDAKHLVYGTEGLAEASFQWVDPRTGLQLKARVDRYIPPVVGIPPIIVDLKTTMDASPRFMGDRLVRWPYMMLHQMAFYRRAIRDFTGGAVPDVRIIAIEKSPGHPTAVFTVSQEDMDQADKDVDALLYTIQQAELFGDDSATTDQYESATLRPPHWWLEKQGATDV